MKKSTLRIINKGPITIIKKKMTAGEVTLGVLGIFCSVGFLGFIDQKILWVGLCVSMLLIWAIVRKMIEHVKINHLTQELFIHGLIKKRYFIDDIDYVTCHELPSAFDEEPNCTALIVFKNGKRKKLWATNRNRVQELANYFSEYLSHEVEML